MKVGIGSFILGFFLGGGGSGWVSYVSNFLFCFYAFVSFSVIFGAS